MKITLDQDKCVASGQCVVAAADVFDQRDEDGIAVLLTAEPPAGRNAGPPRRVRLPGARRPHPGVRPRSPEPPARPP